MARKEYWLGLCPLDSAGATQTYGFRRNRRTPRRTPLWREPFHTIGFLWDISSLEFPNAQAVADMSIVANRLSKVYPKDYPKHFSVEIVSLTDLVVGQFRTTLYIVLAAVGLLLLIGCGNVANLLLARATTREKEFAIRSALGASRRRLVRQLLVESMVLALGGALFGTLLAWGGLKFLVALMPQNIIPAESVIRLNAPVLLFTLGLTILTAMLFGLLPALRVAREDLNEQLRDTGRGLSGSFRHAKLRSAVVIFEVALSLTLLVAAGLLMHSFVALRDVHLGFQPDHVLVARLPLPVDRYKTADQVAGFYRPLLERIKALPGVVEATETSTLPPYGGIQSEIEVTGKSHEDKWHAMFQLCGEGYFPVLKIQFLEGRPFTETEVVGARKLAVVNQTFAKKFLSGESPIGRQVRIAQLSEFEDKVPEPVFEIIGLVADAKNRGLQDPPDPGNLGSLYRDGVCVSRNPGAHFARTARQHECSSPRSLGDRFECGHDVYRDPRRLHQPILLRWTALWLTADVLLRRDRPGSGHDRRL